MVGVKGRNSMTDPCPDQSPEAPENQRAHDALVGIRISAESESDSGANTEEGANSSVHAVIVGSPHPRVAVAIAARRRPIQRWPRNRARNLSLRRSFGRLALGRRGCAGGSEDTTGFLRLCVLAARRSHPAREGIRSVEMTGLPDRGARKQSEHG